MGSQSQYEVRMRYWINELWIAMKFEVLIRYIGAREYCSLIVHGYGVLHAYIETNILKSLRKIENIKEMT